MPPPSEPPGSLTDVAALFRAERARLLSLAAGLRSGDWSRPTPCPGWSVLDLCVHLVGDDLGLLARHRDGHHGTRPPADQGPGEFPGWLDELQRAWVAAARRISPRLAVDLLAWAGPQVVALLAGQDPRCREATVTWAGPDPVPVWLDQARELSEYWIHRQQLRQALGRPSDLDPALAAPVLDGLRWAWPYRLGVAGPGAPGDTVTIAVNGPVAATWHIVAAPGGGWDFAPAPGPRVAARLELTTEECWRLLTNNLPAAERRRLRATGDPAVLGVVRRTRAIVGDPR